MPFVSLPSKPQAKLAYDIIANESDDQEQTLVVFINGLGLPAASWKPVLSIIEDSGRAKKLKFLTFDRFSQGATTDHDPLDDEPGKEPGYGHDVVDASKDLHELLQAVAPKSTRLILVAASIGVHIARVFTHNHPGKVAGLLILDPNIGNKEYSDFWPNPKAPDFKPEDVVAEDCTLEQYIEATDRLSKIFDSTAKNRESLDRRNIKTLLPDPGSPKLVGPDGKGPWLTVAGHDPVAFADEGLRQMGTPRSLVMRFTNP